MHSDACNAYEKKTPDLLCMNDRIKRYGVSCCKIFHLQSKVGTGDIPISAAYIFGAQVGAAVAGAIRTGVAALNFGG